MQSQTILDIKEIKVAFCIWTVLLYKLSVRIEGGLGGSGTPHKHQGTPHKAQKIDLGGVPWFFIKTKIETIFDIALSIFYRSIALPLP